PKAPSDVTLQQKVWPWYPDDTVECREKFDRGYSMLRQLYDKPLDTYSIIGTLPYPWTMGPRKRKYIESSDAEERPTKRHCGGMDDGSDSPGQDEPSDREYPPVFD
ncbi:hypothetical protein FNAPI_12693, partial [Fusarium napiforme]